MRKKTEKPAQTKISEPKSKKISKTPSEILQEIHLDVKPKNETQKKLVHAIKTNDVTVCVGPAGTGKTFLSVFYALLLLKAHPETYKNIRLVKSITQLKGEDLGILPGDENEKMKNQMMSFMDSFYKLIGEGLTNKLIEGGLIKLEVFGNIRGRSLSDTIIIVDEFQNISHDNAKTFLTRFSDNTKVIILGDSGQIDIKNKAESSLETLAKMIKKRPIEGVGVVEFDNADIVRHRLTSYFIDIFNESSDQSVNKARPNNNGKTYPKPKKERNSSILQKIISFFK